MQPQCRPNPNRTTAAAHTGVMQGCSQESLHPAHPSPRQQEKPSGGASCAEEQLKREGISNLPGEERSLRPCLKPTSVPMRRVFKSSEGKTGAQRGKACPHPLRGCLASGRNPGCGGEARAGGRRRGRDEPGPGTGWGEPSWGSHVPTGKPQGEPAPCCRGPALTSPPWVSEDTTAGRKRHVTQHPQCTRHVPDARHSSPPSPSPQPCEAASISLLLQARGKSAGPEKRP